MIRMLQKNLRRSFSPHGLSKVSGLGPSIFNDLPHELTEYVVNLSIDLTLLDSHRPPDPFLRSNPQAEVGLLRSTCATR